MSPFHSIYIVSTYIWWLSNIKKNLWSNTSVWIRFLRIFLVVVKQNLPPASQYLANLNDVTQQNWDVGYENKENYKVTTHNKTWFNKKKSSNTLIKSRDISGQTHKDCKRNEDVPKWYFSSRRRVNNETFPLEGSIFNFQVEIILLPSKPKVSSVIRWLKLENWKSF